MPWSLVLYWCSQAAPESSARKRPLVVAILGRSENRKAALADAVGATDISERVTEAAGCQALIAALHSAASQ